MHQKKIFNQILKWSVIPTFDLVIKYSDEGIILVKRTIAPYKNQWALPGLRMLKGEGIDDTIKRIAKQEVGLNVNLKSRQFLGQYVGKFQTEENRQDISTGYLLKVSKKQPISINKEHFSTFEIRKQAPKNIGAMYKFYISQWKKLG